MQSACLMDSAGLSDDNEFKCPVCCNAFLKSGRAVTFVILSITLDVLAFFR